MSASSLKLHASESVQPYTGSTAPPSIIIVVPSHSAVNATPLAPDITKLDKPSSSKLPVTSSSTSVPEPAGIKAPLKANPRTVPLPSETVNPFAKASPPSALFKSTPSTLNWNP